MAQPTSLLVYHHAAQYTENASQTSMTVTCSDSGGQRLHWLSHSNMSYDGLCLEYCTSTPSFYIILAMDGIVKQERMLTWLDLLLNDHSPL